jgi:hypothetical protein
MDYTSAEILSKNLFLKKDKNIILIERRGSVYNDIIIFSVK